VTVQLLVTRQNRSEQNGTDKMVYGQKGIGHNDMDKMVRTKCVHFNSVEFNIFSNQKSQINNKHIEES